MTRQEIGEIMGFYTAGQELQKRGEEKKKFPGIRCCEDEDQSCMMAESF